MSDAKKPAEDTSTEAQADALAAHVIERFRVKVRDGRCPFCSTDRWGLLDRPAQANRLILSGTDGRTEWDTYTLCCRTCGFVRQHIREILDSNDPLTSREQNA